jgi:hypothetical protein
MSIRGFNFKRLPRACFGIIVIYRLRLVSVPEHNLGWKLTLVGLALLVSALVQVKTLSFYHLHLVYDTVSLVA